MPSEEYTCFDPDQSSGWSEADFANFVTCHNWQFARTMPANPHEYTLRRSDPNAAFDDAVRYIREHGSIEEYAGKPYKSLCFGDYKYWTMGESLQQTSLINRKRRFEHRTRELGSTEITG
jgi:hypothetical protein